MKVDQAMIDDVRQKLSAIFDQVSEPLYHNGEGPLFMATHENDDGFRFYCYELNDVESFLSAPDRMPVVFSEPDFLFRATDDLDLNKVKFTDRTFSIFLVKLVPDSAACRLAIKRLHENNSDLLGSIALINHHGKIVSAYTVLDSPVYLS